MNDIEKRKLEHLEVVMSGSANAVHTASGFDHVRFEHEALPDLDFDEIDLNVAFLGRTMSAPLLVSSMTGGPALAESFNEHIAEACGALGIGFGVGSQRIALEDIGSAGFSKALRARAGDVPILANFGAAQLLAWNGADMARRAVDMIDADALIVHFNPLQEAVQINGDRNWKGVLTALAELCRGCDFPIVAKEVGAGISAATARRLVEAGVAVIDVAGAGGTSWAAVEAARADSEKQRRIAEAFRDWGIPTVEALVRVKGACPTTTLIASGGVRDGIDCAKAVRLGADVVGLAGGILASAAVDTASLVAQLEIIIEQLRIVCFCTESRDLGQLKAAKLSHVPPYGDGVV
ncbi:MAG: type 2 isopentenyl-diphosphate Delta-isomerase [Hyphomicrobiaceae bacterium]